MRRESKGTSEWISQTIKPNFSAATMADERIARWNRVIQSRRVSGIHVNAQNLPKKSIRVLPIAKGSPLLPPSPGQCKKAILAKRQSSTFVIRKWLVHREQNIFRGWIGEICIGEEAVNSAMTLCSCAPLLRVYLRRSAGCSDS